MDKLAITGGTRLDGEVRISGAKNAALPFVKPLTKSTATAKKALIPNIHCLSIYSCLSFPTAQTPVTLPTPPNAIKTALISP